uniref:Uncharacterized protein n=1 Tax=Arundo donax TaxID=35708 RepID=A0A0A9BCL6_ARUDO
MKAHVDVGETCMNRNVRASCLARQLYQLWAWPLEKYPTKSMYDRSRRIWNCS